MKTILRLELITRQPDNGLQIGQQPDIYEAKIDYDPADTSRIACALHNLVNYLSQQIGAPMQLNRSNPEQPFTWSEPTQTPVEPKTNGAGVWNG